MITKYYVDASGNYLGGFQGAEPSAGAIEVPTAPGHARDKWSGAGWTKDVEWEKAEFNRPVLDQIAALDLKRVRPMAEGDTAYLATLNVQIIALRAQLK